MIERESKERAEEEEEEEEEAEGERARRAPTAKKNAGETNPDARRSPLARVASALSRPRMLVHEAFPTALERRQGRKKLERQEWRRAKRERGREADECRRTSSSAKGSSRASVFFFFVLSSRGRQRARVRSVPRRRRKTFVLSRAREAKHQERRGRSGALPFSLLRLLCLPLSRATDEWETEDEKKKKNSDSPSPRSDASRRPL